MQIIGKMKIFSKRLNILSAKLGMILYLPLMLLTSVDVVLRGFFGVNIPGVREIITYLMAVIVLIGVAYTYQVEGHAAVNFLLDKMNGKTKLATKVMIEILGIITAVIITWGGWIILGQTDVVSDILRIPSYPFRLLVVVAGAMLLLTMANKLHDEVLSFFGITNISHID